MKKFLSILIFVALPAFSKGIVCKESFKATGPEFASCSTELKVEEQADGISKVTLKSECEGWTPLRGLNVNGTLDSTYNCTYAEELVQCSAKEKIDEITTRYYSLSVNKYIKTSVAKTDHIYREEYYDIDINPSVSVNNSLKKLGIPQDGIFALESYASGNLIGLKGKMSSCAKL
ncbi:MAG: hypothetical protein QE271_10535 [Bacteriovoracaceae bacterium]|nr:hypothetical protein [Bacteriovoracaceae bacterium]